VLSGAGLSDDPPRAESFGEQGLTDCVVDLVRTGMREILAFQPYIHTPACREGIGMRERGGSSDPRLELALERCLELATVQLLAHTLFQTLERRNQSLGHVAAAERAEATACIG
jgi:hypothetical protein